MGDFLPGIYEELLHENLRAHLDRHPELRAILGKVDPEEEPSRYSAFLGKLAELAPLS